MGQPLAIEPSPQLPTNDNPPSPEMINVAPPDPNAMEQPLLDQLGLVLNKIVSYNLYIACMT